MVFDRKVKNPKRGVIPPRKGKTLWGRLLWGGREGPLRTSFENSQGMLCRRISEKKKESARKKDERAIGPYQSERVTKGDSNKR